MLLRLALLLLCLVAFTISATIEDPKLLPRGSGWSAFSPCNEPDENWWQLLKLNSSMTTFDKHNVYLELTNTFGRHNVTVIFGNYTNQDDIAEFIVYMDPTGIPDLLDRHKKVVS